MLNGEDHRSERLASPRISVDEKSTLRMLARTKLSNALSLSVSARSVQAGSRQARQISIQAIRPTSRIGSTSTHRLRPVSPFLQSAVFSQTFRNASTSAVADAAAGDAVANSLSSEQTVLAVPRISEQVGRIPADDPSAVAPSNAGSMIVPADSGVPHIPSASTTSTSSLPTTSILPQPPATADVPTIESLIAANPDNIAEVLASPEAVHAAMKIGDLKLMGLTHGMLNPAGWIRDALEAIHVGMGIPWWGTIMLTTACLRLALFPLVVRMQAHNSRMAAIADQQKVLMEKMGEVKAKGDQQGAQVYAAQLAQLWKEHDVHPVRSLGLPILQMPLFLAFFFALRKLVALPVPQLKEGGMAWFTDLTMADPYYILPVTSMALTLGVMQMGADGTGAAKSRQNQHMINGFRVATILAIPFVAQMASALTFYWTFSNSLTLLQAFVLRQKITKKLFKIKEPPTVPLPPGYKPLPPPTLRDTIKEGKEWFLKRTRDEAERQNKMRLAARKGDKKAVARSTLQHAEVIRETKPVVASSSSSSVMDAVDSAVFEEPAPLQRPSQKRGGRVVDLEKEARVAAARARRARQGR